MKRLIHLTLLAAGLLLAFGWPQTTQIRLYVIGDSTASPYDGSTYPRKGWAQVFQDFFDQDSVFVLNRARSGRSSKSYYHEGAGWPAVKTQLQAGDFLFIQFGHNDSKPDTSRFTDPFTTYQEYLGRYVNEARAMGVTPVLLTSIHRNAWQADTLQIEDTHGDYLVAMRELADSMNVALIDMANLTDSLYEALGYAYTTEQIFLNLPAGLYPAYPTGNEDNTHLSETGAYELAKLVADELAVMSDSSVQPLQSGLYDMVKVPFAVTPAGAGYIQGPRYFAEGLEESLFARPVDGYSFQQWTVDGQTVETSTRHSFALSEGDTTVRLAEFGLASGLDPHPMPGLKVLASDTALRLQSETPIHALRLIDQAGRSLYHWAETATPELVVPMDGYPAGVYYLRIERSEDQGWYKVKR